MPTLIENDDGATPFILYDTIRFAFHSTGLIVPSRGGQVDFSGVPDPSASDLKIPEAKMVMLAMDVSPIRAQIAHMLRMGSETDLWFAIGALRETILPSNRRGRPGDFDIVVGRRERGQPGFDELALVEVKRLVANADGTDATGGSYGTEQAAGGVALGFDRTLLLHFIVGPDRELPDGWGATFGGLNNADVYGVHRRAAGRLGADPTYGAGVLAWGRAPGTDARRSGAVVPLEVRPAPYRPAADRAGMARNREALTAGFASAVEGQMRFFSFCGKCRRAAGAERFSLITCQCRQRQGR